MVVTVIVTFFAVAVGTFFTKLLGIQEREREEAYIREKLSDICGLMADDISIGKSFMQSNSFTIVNYRHETGGVSLETGRVYNVSKLVASLNTTNNLLNFGLDVFEAGRIVSKPPSSVNGNAHLIPLLGDMVSVSITPLNANIESFESIQSSDAALGLLSLSARYRVENDDGEIVTNTVSAERLVRLWNKD